MSKLPAEIVLDELIEIINKEGIPYAIMGGFAVRIWGLPRPTYDVDIQVSCSTDEIASLLNTLNKRNYTVPDHHLKGFFDSLAGMNKIKVQKYYDRIPWDIDIFIVTNEFDKSAFRRRRKIKINAKESWLLSPEDIILYKLIAGRKRDLADVEDIVMLNPVDTKYLRLWAKKLSGTKALEAVLKKYQR